MVSTRTRNVVFTVIVVGGTLLLKYYYNKKQIEKKKLVKRVSKTIIKPSNLDTLLKEYGTKQGQKETTIYEPISELDEATSVMWNCFTYRFETLLFEEALKAGLEKALNTFPGVAGRYDDNPTGFARLILSKKNCGVDFEVCFDKDALDKNKKNSSYLPGPRDSKDEFLAAGLLFQSLGKPAIITELFSVKLCLFPKDNVSYLALRFNHALGDISSYCSFLEVWSGYCVEYHNLKKSSYLVTTEIEPSKLMVQLGKRIVTPLIKSSNKEQLIKRWHESFGHLFKITPLDVSYYSVMFKMIWGFIGTSQFECIINYEKLKKIERKVNQLLKKKMKDKESWVSTHEVLVALLLGVRASGFFNEGIIDNDSLDDADDNDTGSDDDCNDEFKLRSEKDNIPENVFENIDDNITWVAKTALEYHNKLRSVVKPKKIPSADADHGGGGGGGGFDVADYDNTTIGLDQDWREDARHLGLRKALSSSMHPFSAEPIINHQATLPCMINSWMSMPIMNFQFGSDVKPTGFVLGGFVFGHYYKIHQIDAKKNAKTNLRFSKHQRLFFKRFCRHFDLPFDELCS